MPIERVPIRTRDDLFAERRGFIGASEVPIVCGESPWGSLAVLYAEKKGTRPPQAETPAMKRGRYGEAAAFEALADERPEWNVKRAWVHVRDTERRIACTPDGFATRGDDNRIGIVQAKTATRSAFRKYWLLDPADDIEHGEAVPPAAYRLQTLTEMMLNGLDWGVLAVLVHGEWEWDLRVFDVERDPIIEDLIHTHCETFWREHLDPNIPPPFNPQRDAALVRALYPDDDGTEIDLSTDNRALSLVEDLTEMHAARKRCDEAERAIKTELQGKLGAHTYGKLADGRRISWKRQHRNGYVVGPSDYRVFRIMPKKKGRTDD